MSMLFYINTFEVIAAKSSYYNKILFIRSEKVKFKYLYPTENIKDTRHIFYVHNLSLDR